ncbi:MAG: SDR family oxidoreductase [Chloroflexota bacterium]
MSRPLALVTGGAHRLGKVFALTLARNGYDLLLHYHSADDEAHRTKAEAESHGSRVTLVRTDLTDLAQLDSLLAALDSLDSFLRVLVNSAAMMTRAEARSLSAADWDAAFDLNLRAPFLLAQAAAHRMTEGGLIVNVTDVAAQKSWHVYPAYTVSKAALESLTKVLARAFAPRVRVNAIAPGLVLHSDIVSAEQWDKMIARLPLRRPAELDEIVAALEFLLKNEYVTGQTVVVDGGYSLI